MKLPYIPLTDPHTQLDAVLDFCIAWGGPLLLEHEEKKAVLMSAEYYLAQLCTPGEAEEIRRQLDEEIGGK